MIAIQTTFAEKMDTINDQIFYNTSSIIIDKELIAFIISRQLKDGSDTGSFSLSTRDYQIGKWLYTGERLVTNLAIKNILSFGASKILHFSKEKNSEINLSLEKAEKWMHNCCFSKLCSTGECKHSTTGYISYLSLVSKDKKKDQLINFVEMLSNFRNKNKKWDGFPFYYTLKTLLEINLPIANKELAFALPACEKNLKFLNNNKNKYNSRRLEITKRVFAKTYSIF